MISRHRALLVQADSGSKSFLWKPAQKFISKNSFTMSLYKKSKSSFRIFNFDLLIGLAVEPLISDPRGIEPRWKKNELNSQRSKKSLFRYSLTVISRNTRIQNNHVPSKPL